MKLSVIILNYNVRYFLEQCIESVIKATKNIDAEIIIIDNASSDDSCGMVKQKFPKLKLIENKENVGFSKANNQAVEQAVGEYVCILNPDTAVAENTFVDSLKFAESQKNIGAVGVYLMDGTGGFLPESKRNIPTPFVSFLKMIGFNKKYYASKIAAEKAGPVSVLVGAYMLIKRAIYNEVGGFDEAYFMYGEDIDLSYKIEKAGYHNQYFGNVKTLHYKGESTTKDAIYLERFYGAMKIFYGKHFSSNFLFNNIVSLGVKLASKSNKTTKAENNTSFPKPEKAYLLTENLSLYRGISKVMDLDITASSKNIFQDSLFSNTLFVFDADYMPYSQIFNVMTQLRGRNNVFRIRPPHCNFILGSDRSDEKGTVLVF
ncbi:glycosyl transferase family 2 [Patiriisocius marinistellae]|uniref:Glycosyl transferase family 2 n=1 Tax=Patiriisocius marinistellae TaxID=2494560 RepID=A0A5J4FZY1_9FLAO|nr:glycosyltransferase family 2 protein [Patiriisocius marinistellae]GEQ85779.1 glycosyl transferase family 2 [Patiriisocius marinistellae]